MSHFINENCTMCGACMGSCPVDAIFEGDPKYTIDPDICTDCAACVETCPFDAIEPVEEKAEA